MVFGTHWIKPHSSLSATTLYVLMSKFERCWLLTVGSSKSLTQLSPPGIRIPFEKLVDDSIEIHQPSILPKIILWFS